MEHLLYLIFRCDFDVMKSLEFLWELNTTRGAVSSGGDGVVEVDGKRRPGCEGAAAPAPHRPVQSPSGRLRVKGGTEDYLCP